MIKKTHYYPSGNRGSKKGFNMNDSVSAKEIDWTESCINAAKNDEYFRIFRSSPAFKRVVEGSPIGSALWNLNRLTKNKKFIKALPLFQTSDTVGFPQNVIYFQTISRGGVIPYKNWLSPTTIRYINNCFNCLSLFGENFLKGKVEVYEIGAGYGEECKIFNDFAISQYGMSIEKKWHIYDLQSSFGIIKRFLKQFHYSVSFSSLKRSTNSNNKESLVISNGAFSEMTGKLLESYFDSVISKAKYGYFITNFETHSVPHGGWTTEQFIDKLHSCGKTDATLLPVNEYLSYYDNQAGSKLIVFGYKNIRRDSTKIIDIIKIKVISALIEIFDNFSTTIAKHINNRIVFHF